MKAPWSDTSGSAYALLAALLALLCLLAWGLILRRREQARTTELSAALRALEESELRFRALVEAEPASIEMIDALGQVLHMNPAGLAMLEADSADQVIGLSVLDLIAPENQKSYASMHAQVLAGESKQMEYEVIGFKGQRRWVETCAVSVRDKGSLVQLAITRDITERKRSKKQIRSLAFVDRLTGLPNRRLLTDRLEQALLAASRDQHQGALLLIDLDNFKTLNDSQGHDQGDLLLQQIAKRLSASVREGDTVARSSGDEFIVILKHLSHDPLAAAAHVETVVEKMLAALRQPYQLGDYEHHSTTSIGITLFGGAPPESTEEPLKRAELAMYQAKSAGGNILRFFEPQMQAAVSARAILEAGLRAALENGHFVLHYQTQVTSRGQIVGMEALVRWQDPQRGMVSPAEFIPLAEDTGLILPLGSWVLEAACAQLALWASQPAIASLTMSVNVSARQFRQADFVDQVRDIVERTGVNVRRLKIELTESLLVADVEDVIDKMVALKDLGIAFSLDDFGTGYSSLSYLKRLPLDQLKIDQGFVRHVLTDSNDAAIAKMVVALADSLGLAVLAEGVETEAQRDFLADLGCHTYQGYYFSRPVPPEGIEALVKWI